MKQEPWMAADPAMSVQVHPEEREELRDCQPVLRTAATLLRNYEFCRLAKCRRARECRGENPPERYHENFYNRFPPCVRCRAGQSRLLDAIRDMAEQCEREHPDWEEEEADYKAQASRRSRARQ